MEILFLVFFIICKYNIREIDFATLLELCVNPRHDCYQKAWIEFERRYRPLIFGQIHKQLRRWNKAGDADLLKFISDKVSERLILNNFKTLVVFREREHEGKFIKYLSVISWTTAYAELTKLFSNPFVPIGDHEIHALQQIGDSPENLEDIHNLVVGRIRRKLTGTQKSDYYKERDTFIYSLRCLTGFKSKDVAEIPLVNSKFHNIDIIVDRIKNMFEN